MTNEDSQGLALCPVHTNGSVMVIDPRNSRPWHEPCKTARLASAVMIVEPPIMDGFISAGCSTA